MPSSVEVVAPVTFPPETRPEFKSAEVVVTAVVKALGKIECPVSLPVRTVVLAQSVAVAVFASLVVAAGLGIAARLGVCCSCCRPLTVIVVVAVVVLVLMLVLAPPLGPGPGPTPETSFVARVMMLEPTTGVIRELACVDGEVRTKGMGEAVAR